MEHEALLQQRAELKRQLKEELSACRATRRKIDAIDLLLAQTKGAANLEQLNASANHEAIAFGSAIETMLKEDQKQQSVMESIRQLLENTRGVFSPRTLVEALNRNRSHPVSERDVSHPLWKLQKLGFVRLYKKGSGRRPNVYIKV